MTFTDVDNNDVCQSNSSRLWVNFVVAVEDLDDDDDDDDDDDGY